jgi:hypothetical protein
MDIGVVRDFVISITGILMLILLILFDVFSFLLYREIKKPTNSVKNTIQSAKDMSSDVTNVLKNSKGLINIIKGSEKTGPEKASASKK